MNDQQIIEFNINFPVQDFLNIDIREGLKTEEIYVPTMPIIPSTNLNAFQMVEETSVGPMYIQIALPHTV